LPQEDQFLHAADRRDLRSRRRRGGSLPPPIDLEARTATLVPPSTRLPAWGRPARPVDRGAQGLSPSAAEVLCPRPPAAQRAVVSRVGSRPARGPPPAALIVICRRWHCAHELRHCVIDDASELSARVYGALEKRKKHKAMKKIQVHPQ